MKQAIKKLYKQMQYQYGRKWRRKFHIHKEYWFGKNSCPRIWIEKKEEEIKYV